jgi:2,4-dienoyl-CoA reductase-like NADH-dependent reductase (Old Yellow Enzyme family)
MFITFENQNKEKTVALLNHLKEQKINALKFNPGKDAEKELSDINYLLNNLDKAGISYLEVYGPTWKNYTPDHLKEGTTEYKNKEHINNILIIDNNGKPVFLNDRVFVYFEAEGAIIARVVSNHKNSIKLKVGENTTKFINKKHGHRLCKID